MNRQQRRHTKKNSDSDILNKIKLMNKIIESSPNDIKEGQKVRLDYDKIISHPDYHRLQDRYKEFVETNKKYYIFNQVW